MPETFVSYLKNIRFNNRKKPDQKQKASVADGKDSRKHLKTFLMTINNADADNDESNSPFSNITAFKMPIPVQNFLDFYYQNSRDSDLGFSNEFTLLENISRDDLYPKLPLISELSNNRFKNVLPCKLKLF